MLKALYDYGLQNGLAIPPGFQSKAIRAYICLSGAGEYLGIEPCEEEKQVCPDIGSLANSPDKCNPLAEKAGIVLFETGVKTDCFCTMLRDGCAAAPVLAVCLQFMETPALRAAAAAEAQERRLKPMDRISFRVGDTPIVADAAVGRWWTEYRTRFAKAGGKKATLSRCLITGELTTPLETVPKVSGLQQVGGHSAGEALLCFDKAAFCSYGLKQSANAPVSEEAFSVVKEALNDLLKGSPAMYRRDSSRPFQPSAPIYAGLKFVHWYDCPISPEEDPIPAAFLFDGFGGPEEDGELTPEARQEREAQEQRQARREADRLVAGVRTGERPLPLRCQYHILLISGNNGRAVVRRYEHGSYAALQKSLQLWEEDLCLADNYGTGTLRPCRLTARLSRLVKNQGKSGRELYDQLKKELAGITPAIMVAILNGTLLPDDVAVRALSYIRSGLLTAEGTERDAGMPDGRACQWLKAWANRKRRMRNEEVVLMSEYMPDFPSAAYHCGALMAIYADIQHAAMPTVNAGIVQRYYASASRTPALVLGTLERSAKYHLNKIEAPGLVRIYENRLNEAWMCLEQAGQHRLPATLNLEEQSYFAMGYRQMCSRIIADKKARNAEKAERQEEN